MRRCACPEYLLPQLKYYTLIEEYRGNSYFFAKSTIHPYGTKLLHQIFGLQIVRIYAAWEISA